MDFITIKNEQRTCHGCLSMDRRTTALGDMFDIFLTIAPFLKDTSIYICWECMSILKKLQKLQKQIKEAQEALTSSYQTSFHPSSSTLTSSYKDYYDQELSYDYDNFSKLELKEHFNPIKEEIVNKPEFHIKDNENKPYVDDFCSDTNVDFDHTSDITSIQTVKAKKTKNIKPFQKSSQQTKNIKPFQKKSSQKTKKDLLRKTEKLNLKNWKNIKQEYKSYANIITKGNWEKPHSQYFREVRLNEDEMENNFLINERKRKKKLPLQCKVCLLTYSRQIDLDRHINLNHHKPNAPYKCLHCKTSQPSLLHLTQHWLAHSVYYTCVLCAACVFPCAISLHLSRCHTQQYRCTSCVASFSSLATFSEHYKKNHPFVCDYCYKKCALRSVLEKHMKNHHTPYNCVSCSRTFDSYRFYRAHCREFHPNELYSVVRPEECYCVECDAQFVSVALYKRHVNAKHTQRTLKPNKVPCADCSKVFAKYSAMMLHYNYAHVKITKYHCELCDKYFLKGFGLRTHMERVHLKLPTPKNKICDLCGRAFVGKSVLENHRRTHTGERPFKCTTCPAAFAQKGAMIIHQRKQHNS